MPQTNPENGSFNPPLYLPQLICLGLGYGGVLGCISGTSSLVVTRC
ncbi:MAG: hypothetical protein V7L12_05285 [Nostoc sp.]